MATTNSNTVTFNWTSDCGNRCVNLKLDCTISEINTVHFPIDCISNTADCVSLANPDTACVMRSGGSHGGENIYLDFMAWKHRPVPITTIAPRPSPPRPTPPGPIPPMPTTTDPAPISSTTMGPAPKPCDKGKLLDIYAACLTAIISLIIIIKVSKCALRIYRRRQYDTLPNPVRTGPRSQDSVYESTVQDL